MEAFSELGASGILLIIALLFGVIALLKGIARLICSLVAAVGAAVTGYFVFQNQDMIFDKIGIAPAPWMPLVLSSLAGIGAVFAVRSFFRAFFFKDDEDGGRSFSWKAGLIGLIAGCILVYSGVTGLRYADAVTQVEEFKERLADPEKERTFTENLIYKANELIGKSKLGKALGDLDFLNDPDRIEAAKILLLKKVLGTKAEATKVDSAIEADPDLTNTIADEDFGALLHSDAVEELLKDPAFREKLKSIDFEKLLKDSQQSP